MGPSHKEFLVTRAVTRYRQRFTRIVCLRGVESRELSLPYVNRPTIHDSVFTGVKIPT